MTTRNQILRSSTPGAAPAAGARLPGELWVTWPDLQLGVIDASKNAQRLIAVRFFSTTANYAAGDFVVQAGKLYFANGAITAGAFNSTQWTALADNASLAASYLPLAGGTLTGKLTLSGAPTNPLDAATKAYADGVGSGLYLPLAGGTLTGPLVLAANPAAPLQSATKQYVDALPVAMNDNRIINGDMRIDQRGVASGGGGGTATGYTVDRWSFGNLTGKGTWRQNLNAVSSPAGFPYYLGFQSSSAYTPGATEVFQFAQTLEGDAVSDFAWGTASAQPVTLSFWAYSSLTGAFSGAVGNYAFTRAYPFSFSLPAANTWTKIVVTIPGDTGGAWVISGNAGSVVVDFDLGTGATYRGTAGAWAATGYAGVTGAVRVVSTNAATFYVTGVKLEIGSVATPFNRQSLAKSMADCQRYYQNYTSLFTYAAYAPAGQVFYNTFTIPIMRATPTVTGDTPGGVGNANSFNVTPGGSNSISTYATSISAAQAFFYLNVHCSAEL